MRLAAAALLLMTAAPAGAVDLAAHNATYTLKLDNARSANVQAAAGTMSFDIQDTCDGWATAQTLRMTVTNREGQDVEMRSDYTTWESKDGLRLRFRTRQTTDTAVTSDVAGDAVLEPAGGPGSAHFTVPEDKTQDLPRGTLFPMTHTETILRDAIAGVRIVALPLFDGTTATGTQDSSVAIARFDETHRASQPALARLASGRFRMAFFDRKPDAILPDYELGARYFANGVADDLTMDFGDFVMGGHLADLTVRKSGC